MFAETSLAVFSQNRAYNEEIRQSSSPTSSATAISRKRTNAEIYSTEPDAPSPHSNKMSVNERPRTAPEQNQKFLLPSCFEQNGFPKDITGPKLQSSSSTSATMSTKPSAASIASAANAAAGIQQSFVARLQERQAQLDREYDQYEQDLENRDHTAHIEPYDWENLEGRYLEEMKSAIEEEQEIQKTITERYRTMLLWMQTSSDREAHRAIKRLRTRIAFVQNEEAKLTEKELHYEKVLKAFQSTMALLGGP